MNEMEMGKLLDKINKEMDEAVEFGKSSPFPDASESFLTMLITEENNYANGRKYM